MKRLVLGLLAATAMSVSAYAADIKPAIIYDLGGKFDKSFNEAAFNGAEKFKEETGIAYRDFEIQNDAQREQALRKFAQDGNDPIVMAGFSWAAALEMNAPRRRAGRRARNRTGRNRMPGTSNRCDGGRIARREGVKSRLSGPRRSYV